MDLGDIEESKHYSFEDEQIYEIDVNHKIPKIKHTNRELIADKKRNMKVEYDQNDSSEIDKDDESLQSFSK